MTDEHHESSDYADADETACKYCGGSVKRIVPEGTPYWRCDTHGKLNVSDVLGIEPGRIPEHERVE